MPGGDHNSTTPTAGIWSTYPGPFSTNGQCALAEIIGTMFLMMTIMAVTDEGSEVNSSVGPVIIALALGGVGMGFGTVAGFSVNPFRDFASRCFTAIMYGSDVFIVSSNYFWIPLFLPFFGAILGAGLYHFSNLECNK